MALPEYVRWLRGFVGHERLLLPSASILIFDADKRLLIARPAGRDTWVIPGGIIDPGESPVDAAVREAFEETGLHVEITGVFGVYGGKDFMVQYPNGDRVDFTMVTYTAKIAAGTLQPHDDEIAELRFVTRGEIEAVNLADWARLVLLPHAFDENPDQWWLRPSSSSRSAPKGEHNGAGQQNH